MSQFVDFHRFEEVRIYCASADYLTGQQIKKPFLWGAVFEGLAFSVGHIADVMQDCGVHLQNVRMAGGLARSTLLGQIKADVLGVPIAPFVDHELTSQGLAAILSVATGQAADLVEASRRFNAIERWIEPQQSTRGAHRAAYERYRSASACLEPSFVSATIT